jgi:UDP-N-acetylmuramate dehydrogenase
VTVLLADHTTLHLGGPVGRFVHARTDEELVDAVRTADESGEPVLVLGGGSNLVVADDGFPGTVVKILGGGARVEAGAGPDDGHDLVTVSAGESWDGFVADAVERGWVGVEALSGIPGTVGATPIQNVGAYGQDVSQTIARVRVWDRVEKTVQTFTNDGCGFAYRTSRFKTDRVHAWGGRHVVLDVTFRLERGTLSAPVAYAELARALGTAIGKRVPLTEARAAVLALRRGKGMVLDESDHDTWSAGSFFTNPVIDPARVPAGAPAYSQPDGTVKTSAAWLIEHAGFGKGHPGPGGRVSLSTKHTLALTNRGEGTAADLLALAREVRDGVEEAYGIRLHNEPVLVGLSLD